MQTGTHKASKIVIDFTTLQGIPLTYSPDMGIRNPTHDAIVKLIMDVYSSSTYFFGNTIIAIIT